jgi:hypothetical protein
MPNPVSHKFPTLCRHPYTSFAASVCNVTSLAMDFRLYVNEVRFQKRREILNSQNKTLQFIKENIIFWRYFAN